MAYQGYEDDPTKRNGAAPFGAALGPAPTPWTPELQRRDDPAPVLFGAPQLGTGGDPKPAPFGTPQFGTGGDPKTAPFGTPALGTGGDPKTAPTFGSPVLAQGGAATGGDAYDPSHASPNIGINPGPYSTGLLSGTQTQPAGAGTYDRNSFRDNWMSSGGRTVQDLANYVNAHQGDYGAGVKILGGKGDKIQLPDGSIIDAVIGAGAGGQGAGWTGDPSQMGGAASGVGGSPGASATGGSGDLNGAFRDALLKAMQGANTPYDPNDPRNAAQQNAYNAQRDRSAQQERAAMAERAAASGLNSGGGGSGTFDSGLQGILENAGQDESAFGANLAQQDYQNKRADLAHALDLANSVGARQEAAALQMQLAQLDNQYRYSALAQQQGQFEDSMAFNWNDWLTNQNRNALLAGLGSGGF